MQPITTLHRLLTGGSFVAGVGAVMGVLLGLRLRDIDVFPPGAEAMGSHAAMMDAYPLLIAAALLEWFVKPSELPEWTRAGVAQTLAGVADILVPIALSILQNSCSQCSACSFWCFSSSFSPGSVVDSR